MKKELITSFLGLATLTLSAHFGLCEEPLTPDKLYGVAEVVSPSVIKLTNGETVKLIGVSDTPDDSVFLPELNQYLQACCFAMGATSAGSARSMFLAYLEFDPSFESTNHRNKDNQILAYVYPQASVMAMIGEIKFGEKPMYIIPANSAEHVADTIHSIDFMQKQRGALLASNLAGTSKGEKPNEALIGGLENQKNFMMDMINRQTEGQAASPGKASFLNATIIRSGFGFADEQSSYKEKGSMIDYQKGARDQKLRVHNPEDIRELKAKQALKAKNIPEPTPPTKTQVTSKANAQMPAPYETNISKMVDTAGDKRSTEIGGYHGGDSLDSYYDELGVKKRRGLSPEKP